MVDPALHHCHRLAGQGAKDQLPLVSRGGGGLKVGDGGVGDGDGVLHQVPQVAQAGAQDQGHLGPEVPQLGQEGVGALAVLVKGIVHSRSLPTGDGAPGAPGRSRGAVLFFCTIAYWVILHHGREKQMESLIFQGFHLTALRQGGGPLSSVGGPVGTVAGWALRRGFPPGPGRGRGGVLGTLRVVGAVSTPRAQRPGGRRPGGGARLLKKVGENQGASPWTLLLPLVPTRWFLGWLALVR